MYSSAVRELLPPKGELLGEAPLVRVVRQYPELSQLGRRVWSRGRAETRHLEARSPWREIEGLAPKDPSLASRGTETGMVEAMGILFRGSVDMQFDPAGFMMLPSERPEGAATFGLLMGRTIHYPCGVHIFCDEQEVAKVAEALGLTFFRWAQAGGKSTRIEWHVFTRRPLSEVNPMSIAKALCLPADGIGVMFWATDAAGLVAQWKKIPRPQMQPVSGARPRVLREIGAWAGEARIEAETWAMPFPREDVEAWYLELISGVSRPSKRNESRPMDLVETAAGIQRHSKQDPKARESKPEFGPIGAEIQSESKPGAKVGSDIQSQAKIDPNDARGSGDVGAAELEIFKSDPTLIKLTDQYRRSLDVGAPNRTLALHKAMEERRRELLVSLAREA